MEKCLVTKLKGATHNDSLEEFGAFTFYGMLDTQTELPHWLQIKADEDDTVIAEISGGTFGNVTGGTNTKIDSTHVKVTGPTAENIGIEVVGTPGAIFSVKLKSKYHLTKVDCITSRFKGYIAYTDDLAYSPINQDLIHSSVIDTDFFAYVFDKYNGKISLNSLSRIVDKTTTINLEFQNRIANGWTYNLFELDIANLSGFTNLQNLDLMYAGEHSITGDLSNIEGATGIINLNIAGTGITGNINSLGGMTSLIYMNLYRSMIAGTVEGFVQAQRAAGRTTESTGIVIQSGFGQSVTLGGVIPSQPVNTKLTWTADTITYGTITVDA